MNVSHTIIGEVKSLATASLYFGIWLAFWVVLKKLILAEYHIEYYGLSKMLVGTLVLAKVVLVLEHVSLGEWMRSLPAWVNILMRTLLYSVGVLIVLVFEKAFEARESAGGFGAAMESIFRNEDINQVMANTICLSGALLGYNVLFVFQQHFGIEGFHRLFLLPVPKEESHVSQDGN